MHGSDLQRLRSRLYHRTRGTRLGGSRRIRGHGFDRTVEEGGVVARARIGAKIRVIRGVIGVGGIPGIGRMVCMRVRSRGGVVGARVIGRWRMRRSNIGHVSEVRWAWGQGAGGGIGVRGPDSVSGILILRAARSKRVGMASIGCIFCVTNERFEEALVSMIDLRQGTLPSRETGG